MKIIYVSTVIFSVFVISGVIYLAGLKPQTVEPELAEETLAIKEETLAIKFEKLSQSGNSSCSASFANSIDSMSKIKPDFRAHVVRR